MCDLTSVTTLVVNYKTPDLTKKCVESFISYYPTVKLILIDNGSQDDSTSYIRHVAGDFPNVTSLLNSGNRYHGPAMDQGIHQSATRYVFTLDSDCEILEGGFLEQLLAFFKSPNMYAAGRLVYINRYGFEVEKTNRRHLIKYIHPYAMLLDKTKYLHLSPFIHHGSPCIKNMRDAENAGYKVQHFPLDNYVFHKSRGTCSRYGYGLSPMTLVHKWLTRWGVFF